jgi:hypothetical protein
MTGPVPGLVSATVAHEGDIRTIIVDVDRHPSGGWHARRLHAQAWGLRCHAVATAVMLEAAEVFADAPMLLAAD